MGDPITISDGSGGDRLLKDARTVDEEVEASHVARRTPWPIELHSVEERKKKEEEECERELQQQLQEEQQQLRWEEVEGEERRRQQGERLEELLEQNRQQELLELQRQQQQGSQQLEELLEPPPRSPPQPVLPSPQEGLPVYSPPTPVWLRPGGPVSIPAEPGRVDGVVDIACVMRMPVDPQFEIKDSLYGMDGLAPGFLRDRRLWEEPIAEEGDEAGTSGGGDASETGTCGSVDDDGRFSRRHISVPRRLARDHSRANPRCQGAYRGGDGELGPQSDSSSSLDRSIGGQHLCGRSEGTREVEAS